jgi:predicted nucleic acid-binding protein
VLVKRQLPELGSAWFRTLSAPSSRNSITTVRLSLVEVISALNRRVREGTLSAQDYPLVRDDFLARARRRYRIVTLTAALFDQACDLLERHPLRTYDALHLAAALIVNVQAVTAGQPPLTFLAADTRLLAAARAEGLVTDNPNDHP